MSMGGTVSGRHDGQLLRILRDRGPRSRTELADETRYSPTTITKAVTPLIERGWVRERRDMTSDSNTVGRPAIAIEQVPDAIVVGAVQLGVGTARVGLTDGWARPLAATQLAFDPHEDHLVVLDRVVEAMNGLIDTSSAGVPIAIGVASPSTVDKSHRHTKVSVNLAWPPLALADLLERKLRLPVSIDHNVRAMALSETRYGAHDVDCMAYVYVRTGVGLGLVLHGEPFFGGSHGVTEIAHTRVADNGIRCACGATGCLETIVAEPYLASRLRAIGADVDASVFGALDIARSDERVEAVRKDVLQHLSLSLASVINLLSPDAVLLGGALGDAPNAFFEDLTAAVRAEVFPLLRDAFRIDRPRLSDPGVSAGAAVALETAVYGSGADRHA